MKPLLTRRQKERELLERLERLAADANKLAASMGPTNGTYAEERARQAGKAEAYSNAAILARNWIA